MGNKLLVYISCCLAGRAYPLGDIPEDLLPLVKNQVFEFLIRLHSAEVPEEEEVYPYIHTLLHFDTREFLNVLALTFEDFKNDKQALEYQQRIVDILLKVMVENSDFTPSQVGCLFTFLARQLAKPDNTLFVNRKLFDQVLEFLCSPDDDSRHTERQQVLLELLHVGGVVQFDEQRLLSLAEKAEFYQICEFMYEKKHLYDKIIFCYLKDPMRKEEIFNYIHNILSIPGYSTEERGSVWNVVLAHIQELVAIDPFKAADLVSLHFAEEVTAIVGRLEVRIACDRPHSQPFLQLSPEIYEHHIKLLCRFSPQKVTSFLKTSEDYRLEEAIQISREHNLHEATAYLLERKGDIQGAFQVLLQRLRLLEVFIPRMPDMSMCPSGSLQEDCLLQLVEQSLEDLTSLCDRSSRILDQQQREVCWLRHVSVSSSALKELTMKVVYSMASFIAMPSIIQRILQDPVYGKGRLAEIQGLILGMLETFNYERTLLETTTSLLNQDLHWSLSQLRTAVSRGLHPREDHCNICLQQYRRQHGEKDEVIVFSCGHLYHCQCLQSKACTLAQQQLAWSCYKCSSSQGGLPDTNRATCVLFQVNPDTTLNAQQSQSWAQLRCCYRGPSRLALLAELSCSRGAERSNLTSASVFHSESFQLQLCPPPLMED
uniref:VPS8 subunit of CORVET complex n=1 Tax=Paramormyrops kingsleyae TaxID=1676925 RepID=A0A3B3SQR4_9TELE